MHYKSHQYYRRGAQTVLGLLVCLGANCALAQTQTAPTGTQTTPQDSPTPSPQRAVTLAKVSDPILPSKPQQEVTALKQK